MPVLVMPGTGAPGSARVKICGLSTQADIKAVSSAGAAYVGFVFFPKSPRHVTLDVARSLAVDVPPGIAKVALVVDAADEELDALTQQVPIDMLQLHGAETPQRVQDVKARYGLPVMKAIGISDRSDLAKIDVYSSVADQLLVDAKAPKTSDLPGGNGLSFDWRLIADRDWTVPWMLAGGLTPDTVSEAIALTGANQVDVSSGVEQAPGIKDASKIAAFVQAAGAR